ncbi:MAG: hypothetical protein IJW55_07635 [Clostridia bacterium]|nr:hypothetical protein [Clostridia bacterium]
MGGSRLTATSPHPYRALFEACFPFYLSVGMTYEQYWHGDAALVKAYRKAESLRISRANQMAWVQGRYLYDALCAVSPVLHAFAENGTMPIPYLEAPYPLTREECAAWEEEQNRRQAAEFAAYVEALNASRKAKKEGTTDAEQ